MTEFFPEGHLITTSENRTYLSSVSSLKECMILGRTLEAPCIICDSKHNLIVDLGCIKGTIPRNEGAIGIDSGETKDIALISRVNKPVCFKIDDITEDENGNLHAVLSRKRAQQECMDKYISTLINGDIIPARVTHLEQFGCFVDVGCGIPSLIPIDLISVSRISHPSDRFFIGQDIFAVVKCIESNRICLTHKELLGTWSENAKLFEAGETVTGIIRSIEEYGIFVELAPNLAGLAELHEGVCVNQHASVYIKAIIPEKMKIKLIIVNTFDNGYTNHDLKYYATDGNIDTWTYSTDGADKVIRTVF